MSRSIDVPGILRWLEIPAKKRGAEWWACCPIHGEREPSWQMREDPEGKDHGLWRCFGCGVSGNAVQLAMKLIGVDYRTAHTMLEERGLLGAAPPIPVAIEIESRVMSIGFRMPIGVEFPTVGKWITPPKSAELRMSKSVGGGLDMLFTGHCMGALCFRLEVLPVDCAGTARAPISDLRSGTWNLRANKGMNLVRFSVKSIGLIIRRAMCWLLRKVRSMGWR
jgi:hypothetical protein